ncbi:conjugal transfer protein TraF [Paracidovorax anthurii]|uniref:Conjugal transfer pilus assembly protein TraF n=1 Tax=Paracidovorax anthurii TaxID=78229 RepID=A0A328ZMI5_9BURK|nr:conjugal transfer protein TraF [Paracidovorax anthurii]RAR83566.1 conjugal transfer pilus assembly protein TraF [Paracidovorax anthurii]
MANHHLRTSLALLLSLVLAPLCDAVWAQGSGAAPAHDDATRAYWSDRWRGWHFYEDPPREEVEPPSRPAPAAAPRTAAPPRPPELVEFERLQKTLEDLRNIAIMRPSEANVRRYMELEMQVVNRASYFADVAQRVAWATPELDPTLQGRPVNAQALEVFERQQRTDRSTSVATLGRDHVLFFFYRSDCPYCHAFAPTLQAFEARHGIQVVAVSVDGGPMPGFPRARPDNGIATALQVTQVPAVFLAQPATGKITPIGAGVLSESQLLERISIVSSPAGEALLPGATRRLSLP